MDVDGAMMLAAAALAVTTGCICMILLPDAEAFELATPSMAISSRRHAASRRTRVPSRIKTSSSPPHFKRRRKTSASPFAAARAATDDQAKQPEAGNTTTSSLNRNERLFRKRLAELDEFRSEHGHGSIPTPYPPNPSLGVWAANLRRQNALRQRAEERGTMYIGYLTSDRRRQLIASGFDFTSLTERQFRSRIKELEEFRGRFGHCMVPEKWEENPALGAWVSNVRSLYKRKSIMQQQQQQQQLQEEGPAKIDSGQKHNGKKKKERRSMNLLLQSHHPRKKRQRSPRFSHLDEKRIELLEDMGFVWSSTDRKWFEMLEWAKVYAVVNREIASMNAKGQHDGNNHTLLLDNYREFVRDIQDQSILTSFHPQEEVLALLLNETHAHHVLDTEQQSAVQQAPSVQSNNETMHQSQPMSPDYRIPPNDTLHYPLRIWMINQRSNYNRLHNPNALTQDGENNASSSAQPSSIPSTMTPRRQRALEEIHFPWSGRFPNRFDELRHEAELLAAEKMRLEKERRIQQKEQEEREKVERLTSSIVASVSGSASGGVDAEEEEADIMALWDAEDDEDDW